MNIHKNARLTPHSRAELVRRVLIERQSSMSVATDMGVSIRTVHKWVGRYRAVQPEHLNASEVFLPHPVGGVIALLDNGRGAVGHLPACRTGGGRRRNTAAPVAV